MTYVCYFQTLRVLVLFTSNCTLSACRRHEQDENREENSALYLASKMIIILCTCVDVVGLLDFLINVESRSMTINDKQEGAGHEVSSSSLLAVRKSFTYFQFIFRVNMNHENFQLTHCWIENIFFFYLRTLRILLFLWEKGETSMTMMRRKS